MTSDAWFDALRTVLRDPSAAESEVPDDHRRAAVAMALRGGRHTCEVLLMQRAENAQDRWSGQVSLPGGHAEVVDSDLVETAIRETREEVGLELGAGADVLGALPPVQARARGLLLPTSILPVVFAAPSHAELVLGPEAAAAFWFPLDRAASGELDSEHVCDREERPLRFPSWKFEERTVWGLTHRMLRDLLDATSDL